MFRPVLGWHGAQCHLSCASDRCFLSWIETNFLEESHSWKLSGFLSKLFVGRCITGEVIQATDIFL